MNTKALYLAALATTLLGSGAAGAATLDESIRAQAQNASAAISEEMRTSLHARPYILDVPGVEIGEIKLVESTDRRPRERRQGELLDTSSVEIDADLRRDLVTKALTAPGMFGVYRYMTASALKAAIIVAE